MIKTAVVYLGENDAEYARMLEIELENMGVPTSDTVFDDTGVTVAVCETVNGDFVREIAERNKSGRIIVAYCDGGENVPSSVIPIQRPIRTEKLRHLLRQLCVEGQIPSERASQNEGIRISDGTVYYGDNAIKLSKKEFELFKLLYSERGKLVSPQRIKSEIFPDSPDSNVANVYINYLRKKTDFKYDIRSIVTVRNRGYMLKM